MTKKRPEGLVRVEVTSGVSAFTGEPFCQILAHGDAGTILRGELSPDELRRMAMDWLQSAEAADQDAAVYAVAADLLDDDAGKLFAAAVVAELREMRDGGGEKEATDGPS